MAALSSQAKAFFAQGGAAAPVSIDELVLEFQTDKPSIAAAMKTYLSFLMASDLTASDTDVVAGAGGSAAQARPATAVASATYMTMARKVLAAVNAATVPDTPPSGFEAHAPHEYEVAARLVVRVNSANRAALPPPPRPNPSGRARHAALKNGASHRDAALAQHQTDTAPRASTPLAQR